MLFRRPTSLHELRGPFNFRGRGCNGGSRFSNEDRRQILQSADRSNLASRLRKVTSRLHFRSHRSGRKTKLTHRPGRRTARLQSLLRSRRWAQYHGGNYSLRILRAGNRACCGLCRGGRPCPAIGSDRGDRLHLLRIHSLWVRSKARALWHDHARARHSCLRLAATAPRVLTSSI
jgi:hypothetical protein